MLLALLFKGCWGNVGNRLKGFDPAEDSRPPRRSRRRLLGTPPLQLLPVCSQTCELGRRLIISAPARRLLITAAAAPRVSGVGSRRHVSTSPDQWPPERAAVNGARGAD